MQYQHEIREKKARYTGPRASFPKHNDRLDVMFSRYLMKRGLSPALARANGWFCSFYKDVPRVIIPCTNSEGVPYFQGRDMTDKHPLRYASPASPRDDSIVIVWPDYDGRRGLVICEGPADCLAIAEVGFVGIGLMGNQPNESVLAHVVIYARAIAPVIIVPDVDMPEMGSTVLSYLAQHGVSCEVRCPLKKDLAEMTLIERRNFLK